MSLHRKHLATLCAVLVLAVVLAGPEAGAKDKEWQVSQLPYLTGWYGAVGNDVSDSGYIGGAWIDEDGQYHAACWYEGKAHDLTDEIGVPGDFPYSYVYSVNSNAVMCGAAADELGYQLAARWDVEDGTVENLHPGDDYILSAAQALNAEGDAAGFASAMDGAVYRNYAWLWPKGDREGERLPSGDFRHALAYGLNANGTVVGLGVGWDGSWNAVMWVKGKQGEYEIVGVQEDLNDCQDEEVIMGRASDVGEDGTVVGFVWLEDFSSRPFAYTVKGGVELLDEDGTGEGIAWKTVANYIAGGIGGSYGMSDDAAVWVKGELEILPDLDDGALMEASSINKSGLAVGYAFDEDDTSFTYPQGWYAEKK